jgi:thiol-disulfide isomerase/thioredoxin
MSGKLVIASLAIVCVVLTGLQGVRTSGAREAAPSTTAPEFTHPEPNEWINTAPLKMAELRGRVVLIDFWTFGCWNCYRSFPWLNDLEHRLADRPLTIVGVHSPEFEHERDRAKVEAKTAEFELAHAIMIDNDFSYWRAMKNRYWPAFYVVDKKGIIRGAYVGETHIGDQQARRIEAQLEQLLDE